MSRYLVSYFVKCLRSSPRISGYMNLGSSAGVVTTLHNGRPRNRRTISGRVRDLYVLQKVQAGSGAHSASFCSSYRGFFSLMQNCYGMKLFPSYNTEATNEWNCAVLSPAGSMACTWISLLFYLFQTKCLVL